MLLLRFTGGCGFRDAQTGWTTPKMRFIGTAGHTCFGWPFSAGKGLGSLDMCALGLCIRLLREALLALGSPLRVEQLVALLVSVPVSVPPLQLLCSRNVPATKVHVLRKQSILLHDLGALPSLVAHHGTGIAALCRLHDIARALRASRTQCPAHFKALKVGLHSSLS